MNKQKYAPALQTPESLKFCLKGEIGKRLKALTEQWVLPAPKANPAILDIFRDRDRKPYRHMVPWAGEFAGKYLTHAVQILKLTSDAKLKKHIKAFVQELLQCQASDGYLGCWPKEFRMSNHAEYPVKQQTWDTWGHYHVMLGLLLWNEISGDKEAIAAAARIADMLCKKYLGRKSPRLVDTGSTEMNLAPIHSLCILYKKSGEKRYLEMALQLLKEFNAKGKDGEALAGDYLEAPLSGKEFYETPKPRWESLHPIMGLAELYYLTGDESCRKAFESLWRSILKGDRHNNGGFSSGEQATGDAYASGAIETCCTIAWMAMSVEMLRLTGSSVAADELELSMFNSGLGLISPSGRWVTYDTPMEGFREASAHTIVFQSRAGSSELNCCSVNGPRALGILSEWALMRNPKGLVVNYYGPSTMEASLSAGHAVSVTQKTDYPRSNKINMSVSSNRRNAFTLALRIPYWSLDTKIRIGGKLQKGIKPGSYFEISRNWEGITRISIELDFRLQFWRHPEPQSLSLRHEDWEAEWLLAGHIRNRSKSPDGLPKEQLSLDSASSMKDVLKAGASIRVASKKGRIEFKDSFPSAPLHSAAYCFTEYEAPSDGTLYISLGCDWWYACIVNGRIVEDKSNSGLIDMRPAPLRLPLKKGKNLIGFRITGGSDGWRLTLGKGNFVLENNKAAMPAFASIYRGPILLAYDGRFNEGDDFTQAPPLASPDLKPLKKWTGAPSSSPWMLFEGRTQEGKPVRYCDFASAGNGGNYYRSWLPLAFECATAKFSMENPRRSAPA